MMRFPLAVGGLVATILALLSCAPREGGANTASSTSSAALSGGGGDDWATPGGDIGKTHHSRLTDINAGNVARLGLAWSYDMVTNRGIEATPVVVDGVMITSGVAGRVYALDAATGRQLWVFEPEVDMQVNRGVCCDQVNRGVAVKDGRVFVGALDGWVYALDARTGAVLWKADSFVTHDRGYSITGAPEVAGDVVVIGNGGADYDARGYVTAYDVATGAQRWRFFTVPHDPAAGPQESPELEAAMKTWDPKSRWDVSGGGTVWDAINYDPEFDAVYIGVGNGGPYHHTERSPSGGDNLYLSSIVALDPRTGRMKWHYQQVPGDSWDYTATQPMLLTEIEVDGTRVPVIVHAPKNGMLYVIDRRTGKPIAANAMVRTNWSSGVDLATGRPRMTPEHSDYSKGPRIVFPGSTGARSWAPGAFDRDTGLYVAAVVDMGNLLFIPPGPKPHRAKILNTGAALIFTPDVIESLPTLPPPLRAEVEALPEMKWVRENPASSELRAIDPMTGKTRWRVPLLAWQDRGGVLSTSGGLVFQGGLDGRLNAYDSRSGKLLKSIETGVAIMAAPMTYRVGGVQYVAVAAGWGGGGWPYVPRESATYRFGPLNRILVFRLDGGPVEMPPPLPPLEVAPPAPAQAPEVTPETIAAGRMLFYANCAICHSNQSRSHAPDLRRLDADKHGIFRQILLEGLLVPLGMPRWDDLLSIKDVDAIHAFLIDEQGHTRARELQLQKEGKPLDAKSAAILSSY